MTPRKLLLAIALSVPCAYSLAAEPAPQAAAQDAPGAMPKTHEDWVRYLSDFTQNADMLVDPKKFVAAMNAISEPAFLISAMKAMMDPNLYMASVGSLMNPRAYTNYARTMDPAALSAWTQALMDPQFFNAMLVIFTDPNKVVRWAMAPLDPKVMTVAMNLLNPNVYLRWGMVGLDPRLWNMLSSPMNPATYGAWAGSVMSPQSHAPALGNWMQMPYAPSMLPIPMPQP